MNMDGCYRFQVGDFECAVINDGVELYPANDVIADVPQEQLEQALAARGFSPTEATVGYNCLLVDTGTPLAFGNSHSDGEQYVLVDVGRGCGPPERDERLLQNLPVDPQDIDAVIVTHGDIDHVGGVIDADGGLIFPNARHIMWKAGWEYWTSEASLAQMPERTAAAKHKIIHLLRDRIELVDAETEFMPGFRIVPATGHRPEHVTLDISSAGEQLLYLADAIVHPIVIEYAEWQTAFHSFPEQAMQDKWRLIEQAATQNALVLGFHFAFPGLGRVARRGQGWHWQPIAT